MADSFPSILLFCQSFSISRLIKGLVRISGKRHARISNDLTLRWIRYPRTYTQRHTTTVVQGGGGGVDESSPLRFLTCRSISKRFSLQWKAFHLLDKMRLLFHGWCNVTNMAAILDLPGVRNQVKTERIGIFCLFLTCDLL